VRSAAISAIRYSILRPGFKAAPWGQMMRWAGQGSMASLGRTLGLFAEDILWNI
jgi:hypothetical protein